MQSNAPPIVPSHVFLGEIFDKGVLPINEPTIYAIVSLIQIENIIPQGITNNKLSFINKPVRTRMYINNATGTEIYGKPNKLLSLYEPGYIFFISLRNSYQQPKCTSKKSPIKLHWLMNRPDNIKTTNTIAERVLVLKVFESSAISLIYDCEVTQF
jgi:hypothetical protein